MPRHIHERGLAAHSFVISGVLLCALGCGGFETPREPLRLSPPPDRPSTPPAQLSGRTPRAISPQIEGEAILEGISYGPYRENQSPGGEQPTQAQILEDLQIIDDHWHMLRIYSALGPAETILRTIQDNELPIRVMLGAWIDRERPPRDDEGEPMEDRVEANEREVAEAIRLANAYPQVVFAVCVGNETQVFWSGHRTRQTRLIELIRRVRSRVDQPVSTADDYNFWNRDEAGPVAAEVDFLVLHAYAMWNRQTLEDAVPWTASTVASIREIHPDLPLYLGETGWATAVHRSGDAATQIIAPAGEEEQARFYREFTAWAREAGQPYFYFEAFDEPWKGGPHPDEVEKHWGLFNVDRTPKLAMQ